MARARSYRNRRTRTKSRVHKKKTMKKCMRKCRTKCRRKCRTYKKKRGGNVVPIIL